MAKATYATNLVISVVKRKRKRIYLVYLKLRSKSDVITIKIPLNYN